MADKEKPGSRIKRLLSHAKHDNRKEITVNRSADQEESSESECSVSDVFKPEHERVQTFDYTKIQNVGIQVTKNATEKKSHNKLTTVKKHFKAFFHECRPVGDTDEQGNVELPMEASKKASEDHDSGLVSGRKLFHLASMQQHSLQDRNRQRQRPGHVEAGVEEFDYIWDVKTAVEKLNRQKEQEGFDDVDCWPGTLKDLPGNDGEANQNDCCHHDNFSDGEDKDGMNSKNSVVSVSTNATNQANAGSCATEFFNRKKQALHGLNCQSEKDCCKVDGNADQLTKENERTRKILHLCGLVTAPDAQNLSEEERRLVEEFRRRHDVPDGATSTYPCSCCTGEGLSTKPQPANYYDLLFTNRKNSSFSVRFDMVHCLPRFVLLYRFYKQLLDCLSEDEKLDLLRAAVDMIISFNLDNCTLQVPFGKFRTNAYPALFAYLIVPNHASYLQVFDISNPTPQPGGSGTKAKARGEKQKSNCLLPSWPDKSYVTQYWPYSKESPSASDRDPTLTPNLYQKNVLRKLELITPVEILVTRKQRPTQLNDPANLRRIQRGRNDLGFFENFALLLHNEQPMLGFGSTSHPLHAAAERNYKPDYQFLIKLLDTMLLYVRSNVNTRQRKLAGKEDLSCSINLSLHHSYGFHGHQAVYGFITFPKTSTYWKKIDKVRRQNQAIAEGEVTHDDIRKSLPTESTLRSFTANSPSTGASASQKSNENQEDGDENEQLTLLERLRSCKLM